LTEIEVDRQHTGGKLLFPFLPRYRSNKRTGAGNPAPRGKEKLPGQQFFTSVDPAVVLK
jgi:hypothetical protein